MTKFILNKDTGVYEVDELEVYVYGEDDWERLD
jgi:hypothetical protein